VSAILGRGEAVTQRTLDAILTHQQNHRYQQKFSPVLELR